jgi:hypothetical protein
MFIYPIYYHNWRNISTIYIYIYIYKTRLGSNEIFSQFSKIRWELGRIKDLSATLHITLEDVSGWPVIPEFVKPCSWICGWSRPDEGDRPGLWHVWRRWNVHVGYWWGNMKEREHVEDLDMDGRTVLKCILNKRLGVRELDWSGLG